MSTKKYKIKFSLQVIFVVIKKDFSDFKFMENYDNYRVKAISNMNKITSLTF